MPPVLPPASIVGRGLIVGHLELHLLLPQTLVCSLTNIFKCDITSHVAVQVLSWYHLQLSHITCLLSAELCQGRHLCHWRSRT
jgi:hypothetical protein